MNRLEDEFEFLSTDAVSPLDRQKALMYAESRKSFINHLRDHGKLNESGGFADGSVKSKARRMHQIFEWVWEISETPTIELRPKQADAFVRAIDQGDFTKNDDAEYSGNSKRKFNDILKTYFEWNNRNWEPNTVFSSERDDHNKPDIFKRAELVGLWDASFEIDAIPAYNNLSPQERNDWYIYLAQYLQKPKDQLGPEHWREVNNFSTPSLIRTTRDAGWRPMMIGQLTVDMYDPELNKVHIPAEAAVKNNKSWDQKLTDEGAATLERWLEQRSHIGKYDDSDKIWLNRKGNPHNSGTLNDLLDKLLTQADIQVGGRNIVWTSFRHSKGTYVYDETNDLKAVADVLRQCSRESAAWYVHQTPKMESKLANIG
jgi:Phage integrase family.